MSPSSDQWAAGSNYEDFMGRWSRELAHRFVAWLECGPGLDWLELGCGTGALTRAICLDAHPASVLACDPARPFIDYAQAHSADERVTFVVAGADEFPLRPGGYSAATSLLALNFFPSAQAALERMTSATRSDGLISACVWDYAGEMQFLRYFWNAATSIMPAAREADEGVRFPLCQPDALSRLFGSAGLHEVTCEALEVSTAFSSFDDYWRPLLGGTGPAPSLVASLTQPQRDRLRSELERTLPIDENGAIPLHARAWAVRGIKP